VHHTNEIAQSEAATGKKFVEYWAHGEFLVLDKGKMAKSGNNFVTLDSIKEQGIPALAYRLFCFSAHYRSPLSFSIDGLKAAAHSLSNLRKSVPVSVDNMPEDKARVEQILQQFYDAVNDDLNMPRAIAAVWDILKDTTIEPHIRRQCALKADEILALDLSAVQEQVTEIVENIEGPKIVFDSGMQLPVQLKDFLINKIQLRRKARKEKNFQLSDQIRNSLASEGIVLKDLPDGTTECLVSAEAVSLDINRVL
jgi:cysteinyl-tRNA synthetase